MFPALHHLDPPGPEGRNDLGKRRLVLGGGVALQFGLNGVLGIRVREQQHADEQEDCAPLDSRSMEFAHAGEALHCIPSVGSMNDPFYGASPGLCVPACERAAMTQWRWWSGADLRSNAITVLPEDLPALVDRAAELV